MSTSGPWTIPVTLLGSFTDEADKLVSTQTAVESEADDAADTDTVDNTSKLR